MRGQPAVRHGTERGLAEFLARLAIELCRVPSPEPEEGIVIYREFDYEKIERWLVIGGVVAAAAAGAAFPLLVLAAST